MFDMMKMMGKFKEVQSKMKEAQEELALIKVEGESGGGMVKAVVSANKQLISLQIDKDLISPDESEMMQDLIVAAVNKALSEAEEVAKNHLQKSTQGMMPNIPGMDLSNLT